MTMGCPVCKHREHGLISPDCPICDGSGVVPLGAAATHYYEPATVAAAITYSLDAKARELDQSTTLDDDRITPLIEHLHLLHDAGLIGNRATGLGRPMRGHAGPVELAHAAGQTPIDGIDIILTQAASFQYDPTDRPLVRGMPPLSHAGHPSALARLCDPYDLFTDNRERHQREKDREFHIAQLVGSAQEAAAEYRAKNRPKKTTRKRKAKK